MRYVFRLSPAVLALSPSSFILPASSRVTARDTSSVRPCRTSLLVREDDGSAVSTVGRAKGFLPPSYIESVKFKDSHIRVSVLTGMALAPVS